MTKSNIDANQLNFLRPDRIRIFQSQSIGGRYEIRANAILFSNSVVNERAEKNHIPAEAVLVQTLCHEEVHATAKSVCIGNSWEPGEFNAGFHRGGFAPDGATYDVFFFLNEGVTEKLALEIFREYAIAEGSFIKEEVDETVDAVKNGHLYAYGGCIKFVEALIQRLSFKTGVFQDAVWHAIIRAAYTGERLDSPELMYQIEEAVGTDFVKKLRMVANSTELNRLTRELTLKNQNQEAGGEGDYAAHQ